MRFQKRVYYSGDNAGNLSNYGFMTLLTLTLTYEREVSIDRLFTQRGKFILFGS
ncbi:hypothetical protein J2T15_004984 [Paenibacillus harenae]|uniref:Uncharacterized protein n=1 Tax=Paenibacillus harenae TaxID=306543 RepID=A0ABT9U789_PAEHA|nr:hypothetical protein [Paenibacillus harenae]MDQ0115517.1 hypothetical protein [Paenibacillus harenae]